MEQKVSQMRLVVAVDNFAEAVEFDRDAMGTTEEFFVESEGGASVMALQAGRATLEIVDAAQQALIDHLEVGRSASRKFRVAFGVGDAPAATNRLVGAGAGLVAPPVETP